MAYITYLDLNSDINWDSLFSYYVHLAFRSRINMFRIFIRTLQNTESKKFDAANMHTRNYVQWYLSNVKLLRTNFFVQNKLVNRLN